MDEEVRNLLTAWSLEEYIDVFKQNSITSLALPLLNESMINELFPLIGPRAIFSKNLEVYKSSMHPSTNNQIIGDDFSIGDLLTFPLYETPSCTKTFAATSTPTPNSPICLPANPPVTNSLTEESTSSELSDLRLLLNSTLEGKGLLNLDKTVPLNNAARLSLVRIIGTSILRQNPEQVVRSSVYASWAHAIVRVFPQEKPSVYFHTKVVESTRGIITRLAGKLSDQIHNLKRKYRDSGVVEKRRRISGSSESSRSPAPSLRLPDGITDEEDSEEKLLWLKNSTEPWTAVEHKWEETTQARLNKSKELTIAQYFGEYTALKKPKGYLLVYKGLDVVTAKASREERQRAPHHLLDVLEPHQSFTVVDFRSRALKIIQELTEQGKIPIVVGGTNYYIESIVYNILVEEMSDPDELLWDKSTRKRDVVDAGASSGELDPKKPSIKGDVEENDIVDQKNDTKVDSINVTDEVDKDKIQHEVNNERLMSNEEIHLRLMSIDPVMADRLHPNNRRKMLRSIEVWLKTGRRHSDILAEQKQREGRLRWPGATILLWIKCEQSVHDARLDARVDAMIAQGLIQELLHFHERHNKQRIQDGKPPNYTRGIFQTLGFKEFHDYLMMSEEDRNTAEGERLLKQSIENMKIGTRRYARRQNKMVRGRFLQHPNREVPPIYELDTTNIGDWDTQVKEKAIHIIESYLNETPCQYEPIQSLAREANKDLDPYSNNYCEVCKRIIIGDKEYGIHLKSNRHMKVLKKRNLEEKKKATSLEETS